MTEQPTPPPPIPKFDLHSVILFLWENWAVIKRYWLLFLVAVAVVGVVAGYSVRQFDTRQIDILTSDNVGLRDRNSTLAQNAAVVPPSQWRRMKDEERAALISELKSWAQKPKAVAIYAVAESEARQYAAQFLDIFRSFDIDTHPIEVSPGFVPVDVGLMVGVPDPTNPSPQAREFMDIMNRAGLKAHYTGWGKPPNEPNEYDLFVGPKPW